MPRKTTKERLQQRLANKNETAKPPAVPAPARPVPLAETKPIEPDLALSTSPYAWLGSDGPRQYEKFFKPNDRLTKAYEQALTTFIDVGTRHALEPMRVIRAYFDLEHACYLYTKECAKKLNLANSSNPTVQSLRRFFQDDLAVQFNESVPMTFFDVGNKYLTAGALLHSALFSYLRSLSNIGILAELYKPVFYEHLAEANRKNLLPGLIENHKNLIKRLGLDFPSFFESERQEVIQNVVSTLYQCIKERLEQMAVGEVVGLTELLKIVRTMLDETSIRAYMLSETHLANDALIKLFELTTRHQALGEFYPFVVDLLSNLAALASPEGSLNAELETTIGQMKIVIKQLADYPPHFLAAENLLAIMQQFNTSFAPSIYAECQRYVELKRAELPAATGYLAIQKLREVLDGLRRFYREQPGSSFTAAASKFIVWMEKFSTELQTNVPEALQLINDAAALIVELFGAEPRAKLFSKIMAAYLFWWLLKAKTIEPQQKADIWQHFNRVAADYAKINQEEMQPEQKKIAAEETNRIMDFLRGELMKQLDSCLDSGQPDSELEAFRS